MPGDFLPPKHYRDDATGQAQSTQLMQRAKDKVVQDEFQHLTQQETYDTFAKTTQEKIARNVEDGKTGYNGALNSLLDFDKECRN